MIPCDQPAVASVPTVVVPIGIRREFPTLVGVVHVEWQPEPQRRDDTQTGVKRPLRGAQRR
jgi:hypothetical protein